MTIGCEEEEGGADEGGTEGWKDEEEHEVERDGGGACAKDTYNRDTIRRTCQDGKIGAVEIGSDAHGGRTDMTGVQLDSLLQPQQAAPVRLAPLKHKVSRDLGISQRDSLGFCSIW